jgi:hypothetical protein
MRIPIAVILVASASVAQNGFEFRGMRTGMTEAQIVSLWKDRWEHGIRKIGSSGPRCLSLGPDRPERACSFTNGGTYSAFMDASGRAWRVSYRFETAPEESPESLVQAFTRRYGKPTIAQRTRADD